MVRAKKQHGGSRDGTVGKATPNRTDLNTAVPKMAAPAAGREYGAKQADLQAQDVVPVAAPQPIHPQVPQGDPGVLPGELGPFGGLSARPNEPTTHGAALGAGGGPEVLAASRLTQRQTAIQRAAYETNDPFLLKLASGGGVRGRII